MVVDLGPRGLLFALLKGSSYKSNAGQIVYATFPPPTPYGSGAAMPENLLRYARSTEKAELPASRIPLLVRFRDIADPKSVERVDPGNLAATFGPGVRLRRATLELTRDRVSSNIAGKLPSFGIETGFSEWYRQLPFGSPTRISLDDFRRPAT